MYDDAYSIDSETPKSYAHIPVSGYYFANTMDTISLNIYPWEFADDGNYELGDEKTYAKYEKYISHHTTPKKPLLITEFGMHSKPPNDKSDPNSIKKGEDDQACEIKNQFDILKKLNISGMVVFEFSDEWWKDSWTRKIKVSDPNVHDFTDPEEFFGLVDIHRNKKQSFQVVKELFKTIP